jgi:hypothetical protein
MKQEDKELLLKDLCARLPYDVKVNCNDKVYNLNNIQYFNICVLTDDNKNNAFTTAGIKYVKPYLFPLSSMTDEDYTIYSKIWEDTGKTSYLEGCHHLISTIKAYKVANDFLLSKHYDIYGLIPMDLAIDATGLNIY